MDFRIIELQKQLSENEKNLRNAGADLILNSIYDLKDINFDMF